MNIWPLADAFRTSIYSILVVADTFGRNSTSRHIAYISAPRLGCTPRGMEMLGAALLFAAGRGTDSTSALVHMARPISCRSITERLSGLSLVFAIQARRVTERQTSESRGKHAGR
eukprot:scaffold17579_cov134-Isochrysis_galbana.AAC.2